MVDAGSKLTYGENMEYRHPLGQDPDGAQMKAFLTISRSKTFLEELIHMTTKQTKEKAEACKHTQMIPMLKTKTNNKRHAYQLIGPFCPRFRII